MMLLCDGVAHDIVTDIVSDIVSADTVYCDGSNTCHDSGVKFSQHVYFMETLVKYYLAWRRVALTL